MAEPNARPRLVAAILGLGGGGAERVLARLLRELRPSFDVSLVVFERGGVYEKELERAGVPIEFVPKAGCKPLFLRRLRKAILARKPDVVLSFLLYTDIAVALALLGADVPIVLAVRNNYRAELAADRHGAAKRFLLKFACRRKNVRAITSISDAVAEMVREDFQPKAPVVAIPNGLDVEELEREMRMPLAPEDDALFGGQTVVACGRLTPQKNFALLLRAFARGGPFARQARLLVLGEGELERELKELAKTLGVADRVAFCGFRANPHALVSKATLFVLSSDFEGSPNALAAALFTNGCCVSTDCPTGPSELIDDGVDGLLVPPGDEAALSRAIETLLSDPVLRAKLSEAARSRATANAFRETTVIPYERLLRA